MKYRIWWMTNIDSDKSIFKYNVNNIEQAKFALNLLAAYDLSNERVTDNVSGLEESLDNITWDEWFDYETDDDIWDTIHNEETVNA